MAAVTSGGQHPEGGEGVTGFCDVNWGSRGCMKPRGHPEPCECECCECGHHPYPYWPYTGVLCVARSPYYGPDTQFYGDDVAARGLPAVEPLDLLGAEWHWQDPDGNWVH
jgi:hypothetical protein